MTVSAVHVQTLGQGPDLVLLHGWAMHSGYFEPVVEKLAKHFRLHLVDLPGHGKSHACPADYTIANLAKNVVQALTPVVSAKAIWLGWSLGGSVATWVAAHASDKIAALILVASNPCFVQQADWPHGIEDEVLQKFAGELTCDYEKTLLRFLSLQIRGAKNEREVLRMLRTQMRAGTAPDTEVLAGGLNILRQFDGRHLLTRLPLPTCIIAGKKDTLVPVSALQTISGQSELIKLSVWDDAGHAPFLFDAERFTKEVKAFADACIA